MLRLALTRPHTTKPPACTQDAWGEHMKIKRKARTTHDKLLPATHVLYPRSLLRVVRLVVIGEDLGASGSGVSSAHRPKLLRMHSTTLTPHSMNTHLRCACVAEHAARVAHARHVQPVTANKRHGGSGSRQVRLRTGQRPVVQLEKRLPHGNTHK